MKILIYSDIQHNAYKAYAKQLNISRLDVGFKVSDLIYNYAHDNGITSVLFVGDFYDSQKSLPTEVVNMAVPYVMNLKEQYPDLYTIAISGNHDYASKNLLHKPAITALSHIARINNNFKVIDNGNVVIQDLKNGGDTVQVDGIPYYEFPEHFQVKLKEAHDRVVKAKAVSPDRKFILLIHQTPNGIPGINIPHDTDVNDELYDIWDEVFCGHIHTPVRIKPNFTLVGNPNHRDLSDLGDEKGFWVLDTETGDKVFHSLKGRYPEFRYQTVAKGDSFKPDGENFLIPLYEQDMKLPGMSIGDSLNADDFSPSNTPQALIKNYWLVVDGVDEENLAVGLECLTIKAD